MRRFLATVALAALLAAGAAAPSAPAAGTTPARALPQASSCGGVWVVVDFGSLGGITTRCAPSYGTGLAALRSAGLSPTISEGFVEKISGKPSKPDRNKAYWSYWHATRSADGSYNGWTYSNLGAGSYKPTAGNAEGWRYQSLDDGKAPPRATPPASTDSPRPTPSKTSKKPSPKPSATKKPTASSKPSKPSASRKPSVSNKPSAATSKATATATATTTATTRTPAASTTPNDQQSAEASTIPSPVASAAATPPDDQQSPAAADAGTSDAGSPAGLITTLGIVLAGAAGLGGWWWKGRKS